MKVKVSTNVQKVTFKYTPVEDGWSIFVNGSPVKEFYSSSMLYIGGVGYRTVYFSTLKSAVKEAKGRGLVPKDFDEKRLQNEAVIEIEC